MRTGQIHIGGFSRRWAPRAVLLLVAALLVFPTACRSAQQAPEDAGSYFQPQDIYHPDADASAQIRQALVEATAQRKRVILDFGGNWCADCQILHYYLHQQPNASLVAKNFIVVPIDVGHLDRNLDIAHKYGVAVEHGVPAVAVLDASGQLIYGQSHGGFDAMVRNDPTAVTHFLEEWKGNT